MTNLRDLFSGDDAPDVDVEVLPDVEVGDHNAVLDKAIETMTCPKCEALLVVNIRPERAQNWKCTRCSFEVGQ